MLLPDPSKFKAPEKEEVTDYANKTVFFPQADLDEMAKYFIGNMNR